MLKRFFISGAVLFSSINFLPAQITFQKTFGGTGYDGSNSVQQTTDGGYIIAGETDSYGEGDFDVYLIKTDAYGDSLWTRTFGGIGFDWAECVQQTIDGGYVITGETDSYGAGARDIYLIKIDSNGDTLWTRTFGGADEEFGNSVRQTTDGGFIVAGYTSSYGAGYTNIYLIRTTANGDTIWSKTFGGLNDGLGYSVQQTTDGGYIITGRANNQFFNDDIYLIKTDSIGDTLWTKTFGGTGYDESYSVEQTTDGGYIISGTTNSFGAGSYDLYLIKTDTNGNLLWTKTFGAAGIDGSMSAQQTTDGGYVITGNLNDSNVCLIKTDANGDTLWTKTYGGINIGLGYSVEQTADGGYIIAGYFIGFGTGDIDVYLIKTDSMGNSGCNEGNITTIVTTPATQVSIFATTVTSPATIVTSPETIAGSGGIVTTLCTNVGINEITNDNLFHISPNPSAGNFIIAFERMIIKGNVEILNIFGVPINIGIAENILNESKTGINLKNISAGIYFVKVFDGEKYYCKKIIVEQNY